MKPEILIVEDDLIIAETIKSDLISNGYKILDSLQSGEEVLRLLDKEIPDLILMDIKLEGKLDGIEVSNMINKNYRVPIIYITDLKDQDTLNKAKSTSPSNYLTKPFQSHQLMIAVELALFKGTDYSYEETFGFFKVKDQAIKVYYRDILYLKSDRSYCDVVTKNQKFTISQPLKNVIKKIPYPDLIRVSRSYSVNKNHVSNIIGQNLYVDEERITIGETYGTVAKQHFKVI